MEADLQRFHGVDYLDRWRGRLSLRKIGALVLYLPPDSACKEILRELKPHWSVEAHLLDELRMALVGSKKNPPKPHPQRPRPGPPRISPERRRKIAATRERARLRRAKFSQGGAQ